MTREEIMQLNTDYLNGCESEHKMNELFSYALEQEPCEESKYRCSTCIHEDEKNSGECYECVKGMEDWYKEKPVMTVKALDTEPVMEYPQVDGVTPTVVKTKDVYVVTSMTATVVTTKESEDLDGEEVEDAYQVRLSVKDVIDNLKRIVDQGRVNSLDALYLFGACQFLEQIKE